MPALVDGTRQFPAPVPVGVEHDLLAGRAVADVQAGHGGAAEDEGGHGVAVRRVHGDRPSGQVVHEQDAGVSRRLPERQCGHVPAEVARVTGLGAEDQPTHRRVQPVRPDHQVEPARRGLSEGDVHAARILAQAGDGITENELGPLAGGAVQDLGEAGPQHFGRLIKTVPAVRGRALQIQVDARREIAAHVRRAFPAELDLVSAAALTGAFVGAISAALEVLLDDADALADPGRLREQLRKATDIALRPAEENNLVSFRALVHRNYHLDKNFHNNGPASNISRLRNSNASPLPAVAPRAAAGTKPPAP